MSLRCALALARNIKELDKRAPLIELAYDFRTVAKLLEREERKLMASPPAPIRGECTRR
jgi:hypothetical protein